MLEGGFDVGGIVVEEENLRGVLDAYEAVDGLVDAYGDPYTIFLPPKETESFNENISEVVGNQIKLGNQLILEDYSLKKKPVLVNNKELYYLTDHHSRRGAFTLKKINIEAIH